MRRWWFVFLTLLGLDFFTKWAALRYIPPLGPKWLGYPFGGVAIVKLGPVTFSLNEIGNTGAAWGLFQGYSGFLFLGRLVIIAALLFYLLRPSIPFCFPLWLIATGAIGNAIDYCLYGHVIDFLHFTFWGKSFPIFNVADSLITIGVFLLIMMPKAKTAT